MPGFPVLYYLLDLLKFMSIESVMPPYHLILYHPLLCPQSFQASGESVSHFPVSQLFVSGGQSIGALAPHTQ